MSTTSTKPQCMVDRTVLNKHTVTKLTDIGLSLFAPLCGRNRGAFVLDPPDGHTYGCTEFPPNYAELAGIKHSNITIQDANAIKEVLTDKNVTASEVVDLIDLLAQSVYFSTANKEKDVYACDIGGMGVLKCGDRPTSAANFLSGSSPAIRAATLAGVFVPAPWATGGHNLHLSQAKEFYTAQDFEEMKTLGLNAVQIPFLVQDFEDGASTKAKDILTTMLELVEAAGLKAILLLVGDGDNDSIANAAAYASTNTAIMAMTLPSKAASVSAARAAAPTLPLGVPINGGDLQELDIGKDDENVYASIDMNHAHIVADVASSTSVDDRMKLFYHESVSCIKRSPLEFSECYKGVPVFVSHGFDLSVDDCINQDSVDFVDYGQCNRFHETVQSHWWAAHRTSFAARQLFSYEQGLGWSFAAWKLYGDGDDEAGVLDRPSKLLSLKDVSAAGLMPSLDKESPATLACLNPPESDFLLGDDTAAPSPGPPPDCGNGWWNYDLNACEYWIPPTPAPTEPCPAALTKAAIAKSATGGAVVALVVGFIGLKIFGRGNGGYQEIPTNP